MKNLFKNKKGITLLELMLVIAIAGILSVWFVVSNRPSTHQQMMAASEALADDLRLIRNMAVSRTVYNGAYPGGYGIQMYNGNGINIQPHYILYAGTPSNVIKTVTITGYPRFRLGDLNSATALSDSNWHAYFTFNSENKVTTDLNQNSGKEYQIALQYVTILSSGKTGNDRTTFTLGQETSDGFKWASVGMTNQGVEFYCGDGIVDGECSNTDYASRDACLAAHFIWTGQECDDGNKVNDDYCSNDCRIISHPGGKGGGIGAGV